MAISRQNLLKELLPGLNALFGMLDYDTHYIEYGNFELTIKEYRTRRNNIMYEVCCNWFGNSKHRSRKAAMRVCNMHMESWDRMIKNDYPDA